uniref:Uncharacterized protein n=1 Tax=Anguilla anguilla TaxID=7936 RepID=A0A0E9UTM5_ANGAN
MVCSKGRAEVSFVCLDTVALFICSCLSDRLHLVLTGTRRVGAGVCGYVCAAG